jgi:hypothetical protein
MSFGSGVGDFLTVLKLANDVCTQFSNAPQEFKAIFDEVRGLSIALQDANVNLATHNTSSNSEKAGPVLHSCRKLLGKLGAFVRTATDL